MPRKEYNWPIDHEKSFGSVKGAPPEGHPRRCQGAKYYSNPPTQCAHWALTGSNYCRAHRGKRVYVRRNRYAVSPKLVKTFEEFAKESPEERMSLADEIDAARMLAEDSFKKLGAVLEKKDASPKLRALAQAHVKSCIEFVSDVVAKAAKVNQMSERTFDFQVIDAVLAQVFRVVRDVVQARDEGLHNELVQGINSIKLPSRDASGTTSPEQTAEQIRDALSEMRETIPKAKELSNGNPISKTETNGKTNGIS